MSVAQKKRTVKLLKMNNGMNYYVPIQQNEAVIRNSVMSKFQFYFFIYFFNT